MPTGDFNIPAKIGVTVNHSNVDAYYGPYSSLDEAREASDVVKADGLTVAVKGTDKVTEYWWVNGELVEKLSSSTKDYPVLHHKLLSASGNSSVNRWIKVAYVNQLSVWTPATMWFLFNRGYMVGANETTNCATLGCLYFGAGARTGANAQLFVMRNPELWKIKTIKVSGTEWAAEIYYDSGVTDQGTYVDLTVLMNIDNGTETDYKQKEDATRWKIPETFSFEAEPTGDATASQPSYVNSAYLFYSAPTFTAGANIQIANNVISGSDVTVTSSDHVGTSGGNSWHEYFIKQGDSTVGTFSTFSLGFTQTGKQFPVKSDSGAKLYVDLSDLSTGNIYTAGTNIQISGDNVISLTPTGEEGQLMYYSSTDGRWGATGAARRVDKMPTWASSSEQSDVYGLAMSGLNVDGPSFFRGPISIASGDISSAGSITATGFYESSDRRLKDDIEDAEIELEDIDKIPIVNFHYKGRDGLQLGTIAQDVQDLFPELVSEGKDGYLSVDYSKLACVAVAGVKKLKEENRTLQDKMLLMEQTTDILLRRIDMLEKRIK